MGKVNPSDEKRVVQTEIGSKINSGYSADELIGARKGVLGLESRKLLTKWKPRWVVLSTESLTVFKTEQEEKSKLVKPILSFMIMFCSAKVVSTKDRYTFDVMTNTDKSVRFSCPSGSSMLGWITSIQNAQSSAMASYLQYEFSPSATPSTSTSSTSTTSDQSTSLLGESQGLMDSLLANPGNKYCADCTAANPLWASINLGIFLCIQCSGIHRSLGVQLSKVRSVTMDKWEPSTLNFFQTMGNSRSNSIWEHSIPFDRSKPQPNDSMDVREKFIRDKYQLRLFMERKPISGTGVGSGQQQPSSSTRKMITVIAR
ncbi:hypothetical protein SAMD00019534_123720 [Acytostelium subglobosum LB1]|uniref:hypothetical protein n=1 Tax=Acytostelium subglobosum LB1 TaxID=1410327 RepID=UPI000644A560|nr:hypothetical protein SAMD00019534_123720 [Acytostelium subglobosum LB1]GAM29196.1 hypothetical protein SAMD00019534_123720 [Acytostelium subglobosum LB1]|eukprot:XP_012747887.1 hypothetical protein SAMD00019534_123720 [Acytostelium subglobosum LB1]